MGMTTFPISQRAFRMPATTCSQVIYDHETTTMSNHADNRMEGRFAEMKEKLKRMALEMENLRQENEALRQKSVENVAPSHIERNEAESQITGKKIPMRKTRGRCTRI